MKKLAPRAVSATRTSRDLERAIQRHASAQAARDKAARKRLLVCAVVGGIATGAWISVGIGLVGWAIALIPTVMAVLACAGHVKATSVGKSMSVREVQRIERLRSDRDRIRGRRTATAVSPLRSSASSRHDENLHHERDVVEDAVDHDFLSQDVADQPQRAQVGDDGCSQSPSDQTVPANNVADAGDHGIRSSSVSTPPQAWAPVHVPPPTYTLAGRAPKRQVRQWNEPDHDSAVVPMRPTVARPVADSDGEQDFQPIDLDAVIERRRAAGA